MQEPEENEENEESGSSEAPVEGESVVIPVDEPVREEEDNQPEE